MLSLVFLTVLFTACHGLFRPAVKDWDPTLPSQGVLPVKSAERLDKISSQFSHWSCTLERRFQPRIGTRQTYPFDFGEIILPLTADKLRHLRVCHTPEFGDDCQSRYTPPKAMDHLPITINYKYVQNATFYEFTITSVWSVLVRIACKIA